MARVLSAPSECQFVAPNLQHAHDGPLRRLLTMHTTSGPEPTPGWVRGFVFTGSAVAERYML